MVNGDSLVESGRNPPQTPELGEREGYTTVFGQIVERKYRLRELVIKVAGLTIPARGKKEKNQDGAAILPGGGVVVCDGVGGEEGGEIASRIAVDTISRYLAGKLQSGLPSAEDAKKWIEEAFQAANIAILAERAKLVLKNPKYRGMSTTASVVVPCVREDGSVAIAYGNVGDGRVYVYNSSKDKLRQLSTDDNILSYYVPDKATRERIRDRLDKAVRWNDLSPDEQFYFLRRGEVTQVLGDEKIRPEINICDEVNSGTLFLVCSDGIHDNVPRGEIDGKGLRTIDGKGLRTIDSIIREHRSEGPRRIIEELFKQAEQWSRYGGIRAKPDDMTAVVISFGSNDDSRSKVEVPPLPVSNEFTPKIDDRVFIPRSDGDVEIWKVVSVFLDPNNPANSTVLAATVDSDGEAKVKEVLMGEIYELNRPTTALDISEAKNLSHLVSTIWRLKEGGLRDQQKFYPIYALIRIIGKVLADTSKLDEVPDIGGLREKLRELLAQRPFVIIKGKHVFVQDSSGIIERGWEVSGFDPSTGDAILTKKKNGHTLGRRIPRAELEALRKLNRETTIVDVESVRNLAELECVIWRLVCRGLRDPNNPKEFYSSSDIYEIIRGIFSGEREEETKLLPALRGKVNEILNQMVNRLRIGTQVLVQRSNGSIERWQVKEVDQQRMVVTVTTRTNMGETLIKEVSLWGIYELNKQIFV